MLPPHEIIKRVLVDGMPSIEHDPKMVRSHRIRLAMWARNDQSFEAPARMTGTLNTKQERLHPIRNTNRGMRIVQSCKALSECAMTRDARLSKPLVFDGRGLRREKDTAETSTNLALDAYAPTHE